MCHETETYDLLNKGWTSRRDFMLFILVCCQYDNALLECCLIIVVAGRRVAELEMHLLLARVSF